METRRCTRSLCAALHRAHRRDAQQTYSAISRKFLGLMTQERKSLSLCALCANDFGRLSPRKRCLEW
jgi:hypothetical protein